MDISVYQSRFLSYPNLISKSPAISLNILVCSSLKYFFHSPVLPDRKVGDLVGLMDDSERIENPLAGRGNWCADEEMLQDAGQRRGAGVDQVFKVDGQHFGMVEPAEVGGKAVGDIRKFDPSTRLRAGIRIGSSQDADF